jgi:4,5-dihydroxyphthalate decarboxylase
MRATASLSLKRDPALLCRKRRFGDNCRGGGPPMAHLKIRLACADYPRLAPLMIGDVAPEGVDLTLLHGIGGDWPARAEMLRRATSDLEVDGGESSMAGYLRRIDNGDRSFVALPVFPLRNFTARDLYVRDDGSIRSPADLVGKRVGMYDWVASGSIWYRHFLTFIGVPPGKLEWWIGDVDKGWSASHHARLPEGVHPVPEGRFLSEMLLAGDLEAIYSPPRPARYHPKNGPIVRLFPDCRAVEREYFKATGVYPPQHLVVLRRVVWERDKWLARSLTDAFIRSNATFAAAQRNFPYAAPWLDAELEETEALMGADFYQDGFAPNRATIEAFCQQAFDLDITSRRIAAEEYFAEFLER